MLTSLQRGLVPLYKTLQVREVAYRTARLIETFALSTEGLATRPLHDVLGCDAVTGLSIAVVVVDLRVDRVPGALAFQGTCGFPQSIRSRAQEPLILVGGHVFLLTSLMIA